MSVEKEFAHTPLAKLDYGFDWASNGWLASGETITLSEWVVDAGLTKSDERNSAGITSVMIEGGELNKVYKLTNTITTSDSRKDSRTIKLICKQR